MGYCLPFDSGARSVSASRGMSRGELVASVSPEEVVCGTARHLGVPMARESRTRARLVGVAVGVSVIPLATVGGSVNAAEMSTTVPSGEMPTAVSAAAETRLTATVQDLGTLGGEDSVASAIDGDIVVGSAMTATGRSHAFAYDLGAAAPTMIDLGTLGGTSSQATDVSGDIVVGVSRTGPRSPSSFFYYDLGAAEPTMVDLGIGFSGSITGTPGDPSSTTASSSGRWAWAPTLTSRERSHTT